MTNINSANFYTLTSANIKDKANDIVAIVPLAAIEQHGSLLPTGTDYIIMQGLLNELEILISQHNNSNSDNEKLYSILPIMPFGYSIEHRSTNGDILAGTISISAQNYLGVLKDIALSLANSGINKAVFLSSHGGNMALMQVAALEARAKTSSHNQENNKDGIIIGQTNWRRFVSPDDFKHSDDYEKIVENWSCDVHGGFYETSLMYHINKNIVSKSQSDNFINHQKNLKKQNKYHECYGKFGFNWFMGDLNEKGVAGNATIASAEHGENIAKLSVERFLSYLNEFSSSPI